LLRCADGAPSPLPVARHVHFRRSPASRTGWLDPATYGPAARKAWLALVGYIDQNADVISGLRKHRQEK